MLKILLVIDTISNQSGGAEKMVISTAQLLSEMGHDITIVVMEPTGISVRYAISTSIHLHNLCGKNTVRKSTPKDTVAKKPSLARTLKNLIKKSPNNPILNRIKWSLTHGLFHFLLHRYFVKSQPDIVIGFLPNAITAVGMASKNLPHKTIASIHNVPEMDFGSGERWDNNPIFRKSRDAALHEFDKITVLQPEFVDWFSAKLRPRVQVLPNFIETPPIVTMMKSNAIIGVGRLTETKSFATLINAWGGICHKFPDWNLKIYGEGPEASQLQEIANTLSIRKEQFALMGAVDDIDFVYQSAKLLVHPAKFEGFGLVVAEAMLREVPAIAFADCTGVNALIHDQVNGVLVETETDEEHDKIQQLAYAMEQLLENPQKLTDLATNAPSTMKKYSKENISKIWADIIGVHSQDKIG